MTIFDYVSFAIAIAVILFVGIHKFFIGPKTEAKRKERAAILQAAAAFHLMGKTELVDRILQAKSAEEAADIVRKYESERKLAEQQDICGKRK